MKIKQISLLLVVYLAEFILVIPQISASFASIRPGGFSLLGVLRLAGIPLLSFLLFEKLKSRRVAKMGNRYWIEMVVPIFVFLLLLIAQTVLVPRAALSGHLSGSADYVFINLLYLCIIFNLNVTSANKIIQFIPVIFAITFLVNAVQYPLLIASSGVSVGDVISSYGQAGKVKTFGLFAAANEDANAMMALFPFVLFQIEKMSGLKRKVLRAILILYVPLMLLFNGTRTALIITFPLITLLYYTNLSLKRFAKFIPLLIPFLGLALIAVSGFVSSAFAGESASEGTLGWRMDNLWIPAVSYTSETSPLVGFGSLGWDYIARILELGFGSGRDLDIKPAHNLYVWFYVGWGAIGIAILLTFLFSIFRSSFKLSHVRHRNFSMLAKTCFCSVLAYSLWGVISNAFMGSGFSLLYGIALIMASMRILVANPSRRE